MAANLDHILAPIDQNGPLPRARLTEFQGSLADEAAKAADAEKPEFQTAMAVCDALSSAMDEREKAIASVQGSASVHGSFDLGAHRIDNPSKQERKREMHEEKNRKNEARQKDTFLTEQLKTHWTQRTIQLRQNIAVLAARQRDAERAALQAKAAAAPSPVVSATSAH